MKHFLFKQIVTILSFLSLLFLISACNTEIQMKMGDEKLVHEALKIETPAIVPEEALCIDTFIPVPLDQVQRIYVSKETPDQLNDGGIGTFGLWTSVTEEATIDQLHNLIQNMPVRKDTREETPAGESYMHRYIIYILVDGQTIQLCFINGLYITLAGTGYIVERDPNDTLYLNGKIDEILRDYTYAEYPN